MRAKPIPVDDAVNTWRRFAHLFTEADSCWEWPFGRQSAGYGVVRLIGARRQVYAHRLSYVAHTGADIDGSMEVDHVCRNRSCVNPEHLEPVTPGENQRRAKLDLGVCQRGHDLSIVGIYVRRDGSRSCYECRKKSWLNAYYRRPRQLILPKAPPTECPHGHPYDEANTYWWRTRRICRACAARRQRNRRARLGAGT